MKHYGMWLIAVLGLTAGTASGAENLVKNGDCESVDGWGRLVTLRSDDAHGGAGCLAIAKERAWVRSPNRITIEPGKRYRISAALRSLDPAQESLVYAGIIQYDENGRVISICHVTPIPNSAATIAEAAPAGATELKIRGDWSKMAPRRQGMVIAFDAREDYSDLPNRKLSPQIKAIDADGDLYRVTLKSPLKQEIAADTPVRLHNAATGHSYGLVFGKKLPARWETYTRTVQGEARPGKLDAFWPTARSFQVLIVGNYVQKSGSVLLVDDVSVVAEPIPAAE